MYTIQHTNTYTEWANNQCIDYNDRLFVIHMRPALVIVMYTNLQDLTPNMFGMSSASSQIQPKIKQNTSQF